MNSGFFTLVALIEFGVIVWMSLGRNNREVAAYDRGVIDASNDIEVEEGFVWPSWVASR